MSRASALLQSTCRSNSDSISPVSTPLKNTGCEFESLMKGKSYFHLLMSHSRQKTFCSIPSQALDLEPRIC